MTTTKDSLEVDFVNRHFKGEFVCEPWCHELRAWVEESTSKESSVSAPSFQRNPKAAAEAAGTENSSRCSSGGSRYSPPDSVDSASSVRESAL